MELAPDRAHLSRPRTRRHPPAQVQTRRALDSGSPAPGCPGLLHARSPVVSLQARSIGPACHAVIESLFANRVLDNLRAAQGVIGLGESFGRVEAEAACARAVSFGVPKYFAVKKILHDGLDRQEQPQPASALEAPYSGGAALRAQRRRIFCTEPRRARHTRNPS